MRRFWLPLLSAALVAAAAFAPVSPAGAQGGWRGKPFLEWTKADAEDLLIESPWAQTVARSGSAIRGTGVSAPDPALTVRLRSALPIRQAMLRLRQLREKYDQMSDKKKAEFDEKNAPLIECPACADSYVVAVLPPPGGRLNLPNTFISTPPEKFKRYVYLSDEHGTTRALVHYAPPKTLSTEAVFFFDRFDEKGNPLITPSSKKLVLNIGPEVLGGDTALNRFEFNVSKMLIEGKVGF